jgi:signal transduction histidine kinase
VQAQLGFGVGATFSDPPIVSKEAAQLINRLRRAIDDVREFVRHDEATRRQEVAPVDQAAELLTKWLAAYEFFERQLDLVRLPQVRIAGELERLADFWTGHPLKDARPKNDREMAEVALRAGYWPLVDMRKHPTVADVIAQVRKAVRQIQKGN